MNKSSTNTLIFLNCLINDNVWLIKILIAKNKKNNDITYTINAFYLFYWQTRKGTMKNLYFQIRNVRTNHEKGTPVIVFLKVLHLSLLLLVGDLPRVLPVHLNPFFLCHLRQSLNLFPFLLHSVKDKKVLVCYEFVKKWEKKKHK